MDNDSNFFRKLFRTPSLLWKGGAGVIFFCFSVVVFMMPSLTQGFTDNSRNLFAALLFFYSLFKFYTFYSEYNNNEDE